MTEARPPKPSKEDLPWVVEALLFVSEEPLSLGAIARACGVGEGAARRAVKRLSDDYVARGLRIQEAGQRFQIVTAPEHAAYVARLLGEGKAPRLSRASLEVLSIVAYKQPCTRAEVEAIRGVDCGKLIQNLEARELIEVAGTDPGPGRPKLYRTTPQFFEHFGLAGPADLPPLPDGEEDLAEIESEVHL